MKSLIRYFLPTMTAAVIVSFNSCSGTSSTNANDSQVSKNSKEYLDSKADWYFKQIPDHSDLEHFNPSAFSDEFCKIIIEAFIYDNVYTEAGYLDGESIAYWYIGQDSDDGDCIVEKNCSICGDNSALIKISYRNCGTVEDHVIKLLYVGGDWKIDDFDDMKKNLKSSNRQLSNGLIRQL